jgi:hypothetical protein
MNGRWIITAVYTPVGDYGVAHNMVISRAHGRYVYRLPFGVLVRDLQIAYSYPRD